MAKSDKAEAPAPNAIHVEQMDGFVRPPLEAPALSVWDMQEPAPKSKQSAPATAPAESGE